MPKAEWIIEAGQYFERLELTPEKLQTQLSLPEVSRVQAIIPLRDMRRVTSMIPIKRELLAYLLRRIKTLDGQMPYQNASFHSTKVYPGHLSIGQKFAYKETCEDLLGNMLDIFNDFAISGGISDLGAYFIFGFGDNGAYLMSCYLPPIIEVHNNIWVVMDGIHRNFLTKQVGSTINTILVREVSVEFPCSPRDWQELRLIPLAEKPKDIQERYFDLEQRLFRDLKYLGIDG